MKKIVIIVLILSLFTITIIKAQDKADKDPRSKFYFGPKAGYNYANVYDTQGENFQADGKVGFVAGAFFSIPIGKIIGLQPELLFSQKGFHATGTIAGSPYEITRTSNYIDVPVLFSLKPGRVITLLAGPQFSYLIKQKDEFEGAPLNVVQVQEFRNENIRKNTLGFVSGIDFNFKRFVLGTRLAWDIKNNNGDGTSTTPRYKNVWLQGTLGYRF